MRPRKVEHGNVCKYGTVTVVYGKVHDSIGRTVTRVTAD